MVSLLGYFYNVLRGNQSISTFASQPTSELEEPVDLGTIWNDLTHIVWRWQLQEVGMKSGPSLLNLLNPHQSWVCVFFYLFALTAMINIMDLSVSLGGAPWERTSKLIAVASCRKTIAIVPYLILSSLVLKCALSFPCLFKGRPSTWSTKFCFLMAWSFQVRFNRFNLPSSWTAEKC